MVKKNMVIQRGYSYSKERRGYSYSEERQGYSYGEERRGTAVRKVGGGRPMTTTAGDDRYIILKVKKRPTVVSERHCSATFYSNGATSVAVYCGQTPSQRDLFARLPECCLPLKVDHRRHRLPWCREHKNWTTVNGIVSSLWMRVGSVPEAILNAF
ncbi:transposable element Tcb2 transposase [Trichonephila clavipes]|nr:transposable element Tcb2 transposase [Trichonephila clavipes]